MAWTWIRPVDPRALEGRPLLDLGTGDAQTLSALTGAQGLRVGLDRSLPALRAARRPPGLHLVCGDAEALPFRRAWFRTVLAADLFHHLRSHALHRVLAEIRGLLLPDGRLVAWWYMEPGRPGPGAPAHPRSFEEVAATARTAGFSSAGPLDLRATLEPAPPTVGMVAGC